MNDKRGLYTEKSKSCKSGGVRAPHFVGILSSNFSGELS